MMPSIDSLMSRNRRETDAARAKELLEQFGMSTKPPPVARTRSPDWN
jgi:hypothetical protein